MVTQELRPIREVERQMLLAQLAAPSNEKTRMVKQILACLGFLLLSVALFVGLVILLPNPVVFCLYAVILLIYGRIWIVGIICLLQQYFQRKRRFYAFIRPRIESTFNTGTVLSTRIVAASVIEVMAYADDGPGFIFDVGEDRSFLLKVDWYDPVNEKMPCSEFELVRSADKKLHIALFCAGAKLEPTRFGEISKFSEIAWEEMEEVVAKPAERVFEDLFGKKRTAENGTDSPVPGKHAAYAPESRNGMMPPSR